MYKIVKNFKVNIQHIKNIMPSKNILKNINLLKKYDVYAFDYIEYPHKSFWVESKNKNNQDFLLSWEQRESSTKPIMLYLHIPFCHELCSFCICHREITNNYSRATDYLYNSMFREIELVEKIFQQLGINPPISEVYFGGGSPTYLEPQDFTNLHKKLSSTFNISASADMTIEIDPRRIEPDRLDFYADLGINKLSFGIQDFDINVQRAINRIQPSELTENLLLNKREKFSAVNFDLLVGLPQQTVQSIENTIKKCIEMSPDRVSLAYLHYGPKHHVHQRLMLKEGLLPDFYDRKSLFMTAVNELLNSGYIRTGFEHFALPSNSVAKAVKNGTAIYNSFGSTTGETDEVLAIGRSSYSTVGNYYFQTTYDKEEYEKFLEHGVLPIHRFHKLSIDDQIRRHIIKSFRTYFTINFKNIEIQWNIIFVDYFKSEISKLMEFETDGLLNISNKSITLTEEGQHFSNLIGSVFDKYLKREPYKKEISIRVLQNP